MPVRMRTQQIETAFYDVVTKSKSRPGDVFPLATLHARADDFKLTRNDIFNGVQSLKNKHLLTADERLTENFFSYFNQEAVSA